jgi:hypothetical protein
MWKKSLEASRARRAAAAIARRRRLRARGSTGSLLAVALLTGVLGAGMAVGHEVSQRPAAQASAGSLKIGSGGPAVTALQRKLGIAADGVFGRQTRSAVRRFQRRNGLTVDGIAGPKTLGALGLSARSRANRAPAGGERSRRGGAGTSAALQRIAQCESGGDPTAVSPDGRYRGKYQFDRATWRAMGGSGDPAAAPEAEQDWRAQQLYDQRGGAAWPSCA